MHTYRVIYTGGDYQDTTETPEMTDDIVAVIDLAILEGGDAYRQLLHTLEPVPF